MIEVIAVHMVGGTEHEHIAALRYRPLPNGQPEEVTRQGMVNWVRENPGQAIVRQGGRTSYVGVVDRQNAPDYVRTYADNYWNNNLLALEKY